MCDLQVSIYFGGYILIIPYCLTIIIGDIGETLKPSLHTLHFLGKQLIF
ncbi:hypothetical protein R3I93_005152 [Phoxinus phoxinus]|uniref:Uncharacterized protein n=1 Tax=Phoxinus phoxinus TaxID=58324 RepID=A0AAN9DAD3_9TELE